MNFHERVALCFMFFPVCMYRRFYYSAKEVCTDGHVWLVSCLQLLFISFIFLVPMVVAMVRI